MSIRLIYKIGVFTLIALFVWTTSVCGLPEIEEVASGDAHVEYPDDNTLKIDATDKTIINYSSFDIMENEAVIISLPSQNSQILNRVLGPDSSQLLGSLNCNGLFILINPSGIYVGPNANIDIGDIILSTRNITDSNFLDGNYLFKKLSPQEIDRLLVNKGKITIQEGGFGVFIAGAIENDGQIIAPLGKVVLAGCDAVKLELSEDGLISVAIEEKAASTIVDSEGNPITEQIKNTGSIEADGGMVILKAESLPDIFEKAINLDGFTRATKMEEVDGVIRLVADGDVRLAGEVEAARIELDGNMNFHNFECTGAGTEIYFEAGKLYTFTGYTYIKGAYGYEGFIKLFSSREGSPWYSNFLQPEDVDISYAAIRDAHHIGDTVIKIKPANNLGNCINWDTDPVWLGGIGENWSNNDNWQGGSRPAVADTATFDGDDSNVSCRLDQDFTIAAFEMQDSYSGTLTLNTVGGVATTLTVTGAVNQSCGTIAGTGSIIAEGNVTGGAGGNWTGGTLEFKSAGAPIWTPGSVTWYNLTVNLQGADDRLIIAGGATADVTGDLTLTDGRLRNGGTVRLDGDLIVGANSSSDNDATVILDGGGAQEINFTGAGAVCNLTIDKNTGTISVNAASNTVDVGDGGDETFTITNPGDGFDLNGRTITCAAFTLTTGTLDLDGGTIDSTTYNHTAGIINDTAGGGQIQASGNVTATAGTWNAGKLLLDRTASGQIWTPGAVAWYDVEVNNTAADDRLLVQGGAANVTNDLTLTNGRLNTGTINVDGDISVGAAFTNTGADDGTIILDGADAQVISITAGGTFPDNLEIDKNSGIATLNNDINLGGTLTITNSTFYLNGNDPTVTGVFSNTNNGTLRLQGAEDLSGLTLDVDSGTVEYAGDDGTTPTFNISNCYGLQYNHLKIDSTAGDDVFTAGGNLDINGNLSIDNGILDVDNNDIDLTGTFSNDDTLRMDGSRAAFTSFANDTDTGTIEYDGSGDYTAHDLTIGNNYFNLTISGAGDFAHAADLDIDGTFTQSNGNFTAPGGDINVAGSFDHSGGVFTHNNGEVIFDGGTASKIYGETAFNDFTCVTAGKQLDFEAGSTQTIEGALTLRGASGDLILVRSTASPTQASIDPQGTIDVSFVDVQDSNNVSGTLIDPPGSIDSGNTTNWFPVTTASDEQLDEESDNNLQRVTTPRDPFGRKNFELIELTEMAKEAAEVEELINYEEGKRKYAKDYEAGRYRTSVIVYEGKVIIAPYDDEGAQFDRGTYLTAGEEISQEGEVE